MREDDGVEEDDLARNHNVAAEDGNGGVQLATGVKQGIVLHLGEWFVGVGVIWGPLHPGPVAHRGVPAHDRVNHQRVFSNLRISQDDTFTDPRPSTNPHILADADIGSQDCTWVHHCCLMDENIADNSRSFGSLLFFGQSVRVTGVIKSQKMSVGVDGAAGSLDLTPPVGGQVEEGGVGAGDVNQHILLDPDCFSSVTISAIWGCKVLGLLAVEHILEIFMRSMQS